MIFSSLCVLNVKVLEREWSESIINQEEEQNKKKKKMSTDS